MTANENTHHYHLTADVDAPVATVWQAWTNDKQYEAWSRSVPGSVAQDVQPGGKWQASVALPDGQEFPITGTYLNVVENERLDMTMDVPGSEPEVMHLELTDLGEGRTRVALSQTCATQEGHDQAKQGSQMLLDWCAEYVTGS
ncbi:SRPBCC family protein [Glycomyces buryatensis]|uniref:SRPBCC domain-containing protein n=1 Tax=Glycomyces buryatensis TaxID=2570927 RepID=A0A4S8Q9T0_9ACTN|nr:SRPBCC domain-containing protein [Glycomyces buryatensis]THV40211.1 SRPBCC domain-containing protein [Glycomyces buryatensis]